MTICRLSPERGTWGLIIVYPDVNAHDLFDPTNGVILFVITGLPTTSYVGLATCGKQLRCYFALGALCCIEREKDIRTDNAFSSPYILVDAEAPRHAPLGRVFPSSTIMKRIHGHISPALTASSSCAPVWKQNPS